MNVKQQKQSKKPQTEAAEGQGKQVSPPAFQLKAEPIQMAGGGGNGGTNTKGGETGSPFISPALNYTPADNTSVSIPSPYFGYMPEGSQMCVAEPAFSTETTTGHNSSPAKITSNDPVSNKLGIKESVGKDGANKAEDVEIVKKRLQALALIPAGNTDQATIDKAIEDFQKNILKAKKPDGKISPGGDTDRALMTAYVPQATNMADIKTARAEFTHTVTGASADFATSLSGVTLNASSTADTISVSALLAIQTRLSSKVGKYPGKNFKNANLSALKDKKVADMTPDEKKVVSTHIKATVDEVKILQTKEKIADFATRQKGGKYILSETATAPGFTAGEIKDGDATFIFMRDFKWHTYSWTGEDGKAHSQTGRNMVNNKSTTDKEGVSVGGKERAANYDPAKISAAGVVAGSRAEALVFSSSHEGGFDAINTWDRAILSWGFIQFAGGPVGNVAPLFARIKALKPATWQTHFQRYGIDVEYKTNSGGAIDNGSCKTIAFKDDGTKLTGIEAETYIKATPELLAMLMKAAEYDDVKDVQIKYAVTDWIEVAERQSLGYNLSILKATKASGIKVYSDAKEIEAFKKTAEYTSLKAEGKIGESTWGSSLKDVKLKEICTSEKDLAALYSVAINNPTAAANAMRGAVKAIILRDGLTTLDQVKAISTADLLEEAKKNLSDTEHISRVQKSIDKESLASDK